MSEATREEQLLKLAENLLLAWIQARHQADALWLTVQSDPEWARKFTEHLDDPARQEATEANFWDVFQAIEEITEGEDVGSAFSLLGEARHRRFVS